MKRTDRLSVDALIRVTKVMFGEFSTPKIVPDVGTNFISDLI